MDLCAANRTYVWLHTWNISINICTRRYRIIFRQSWHAEHVQLQRVWCNGSLHHTLGFGRNWHSVSLFTTSADHGVHNSEILLGHALCQSSGPFVLQDLKIGSRQRLHSTVALDFPNTRHGATVRRRKHFIFYFSGKIQFNHITKKREVGMLLCKTP